MVRGSAVGCDGVVAAAGPVRRSRFLPPVLNPPGLQQAVERGVDGAGAMASVLAELQARTGSSSGAFIKTSRTSRITMVTRMRLARLIRATVERARAGIADFYIAGVSRLVGRADSGLRQGKCHSRGVNDISRLTALVKIRLRRDAVPPRPPWRLPRQERAWSHSPGNSQN